MGIDKMFLMISQQPLQATRYIGFTITLFHMNWLFVTIKYPYKISITSEII